MEHAFVVGGSESGAEPARDLQRFVVRKPSDTSQERTQILAIHVLHGEKDESVSLADVVNAADVGMRDAACDADFVVKAFKSAFIACCGFRKKLQRDRLVQR